MIVRDAGSHLLLVTQPDHAALAGRLMAHWRADGLPERPTREAALYATVHHDVGWIEEDAAPTVNPETGRPFDFIDLASARRQAIWPRAVATLARSSSYVAALVAQHALTIYRRYRHDPDWASFFADMEHARDHWFTSPVRPDGSSGGPLDPPPPSRLTFLQDYAVVRMGDVMSLAYCNGWATPEEFEGYAVWSEQGVLKVRPDPFDGQTVDFEVPARRLPSRVYRSDDDLRSAIATTSVEALRGRAVGVPAAS